MAGQLGRLNECPCLGGVPEARGIPQHQRPLAHLSRHLSSRALPVAAFTMAQPQSTARTFHSWAPLPFGFAMQAVLPFAVTSSPFFDSL